MQPATANKRTLPGSVFIVALIFGLSALWQLFVKAIPAFVAGHPDAFQEAISVVVSALVIWGIATLRPWARTLGLLIAAAGVLIPSLILGLIQHPEFSDAFYKQGADSGMVVRFLTIIGVLSLISFLLLKSDSAKEAFNSRR